MSFDYWSKRRMQYFLEKLKGKLDQKQNCKQFYGTCDTAADVAAKVVTVSSDQNFVLTTGCVVYVKFANTNSANNVTLNVNGSGAKSITFGADTVITSSNGVYTGTANYTNQYMYDGTYWKFAGYSNEKDTTYSSMSLAEMRAGTATSNRLIRADRLATVTEERIDGKIQELDVTGDSNIAASKTIKSWSEADGKVSVTTQDISITKSQVSDFPTLGTAAAKDVPSSGNASTSQVVMGNDSRLSDSRPASDVSAWAKASTKPSYTASEVNAVSTEANQGLTDTQKSNARANIGAGTSSTDENVKQAPATGNTDRRILLSSSDSDSTQTNSVYKNSGFIFNPSKSALVITRETTTADDSLSSINLSVKDTDLGITDTSTISARSPHTSSGSGANLVVNAKGALFAGGGESANNLYLALKGSGTGHTSENAFFTADSSAFLLSNCNTIENRLGIGLDTNGAIKPVLSGSYADNAGKIGISGNRFAEGNFVALNGTTLNGSTIGSSPKFTDTPSSYFGTCASDADVAAKTVVLENATGFELVEGIIIGVKFTNTNAASSITLNVNNTGDKSIWYGTSIYTGNAGTVTGSAGGTNYYMYDGTYWVWLNAYKLDGNTNTIPSAYCETDAATAAKAASCSGYYLLANSYIHIIFTKTNSSKTALTLNINGKGAKPIYINGTASSSSNYTITRGSYILYYDGTNYYLRNDGKLTGAGLVNTSNNSLIPSYSVVSKTDNGLCPQLPNETATSKFLRQDGTWQTPPDTVTEKLYASGTFTSSTSTQTVVTVTNSNISIDSDTSIEVRANVFGMHVEDISVTGSGTSASISVTFPITDTAQTISYKVIINTI